MRKYTLAKNKQIKKLYCNGCGKELKIRNGIVQEGVLTVKHEWSYFSEKDGEVHSFDLCEKCYDKLTKVFKIPVSVKQASELL